MVTGSIAAYKACELTSLLVKNSYKVQVAMTESAKRFIGSSTFEGLSGNSVHSDIFQEGQQMDHIHLTRWADAIVIYPATANTVAEFAVGLSHNLVSSLFLANNFQKPVIVAPAMNTQMLLHPATQKNIETLKTWGCKIALGETGSLACGEYGEGRLIESESMFNIIKENLG